MRVPQFIMGPLSRRLLKSAACRPFDFRVGADVDPYLLRWWVIPRNRWFNVYLHQFLRSDDPRALHDHMYFNASLLISGAYTEQTIKAGGVIVHRVWQAGDLKLRTPWGAHRIELHDGPCWSLFVTGPRIREWGFHCPRGWMHWRDFTDRADPGRIGPGCGGDQ